MVRVKICGITNAVDAHEAVVLGAWALGFIFYKKSPRYIAPKIARGIVKQLPPFVTPVGVFVNEREQIVQKVAGLCGLKVFQFHGEESPAYCLRFKGCKIIKAFRINRGVDLEKIQRYPADAFLFDTFQEGKFGGSGKTFDWRILKGLRRINVPIILSGGLNPRNVARAVKEYRPYAVDVASGVEKFPGQKDKKLLKDFFRNISTG